MVDLTPDPDGTPRARLLDLVPGRSGKAYPDWLAERGRAGHQVQQPHPAPMRVTSSSATPSAVRPAVSNSKTSSDHAA